MSPHFTRPNDRCALALQNTHTYKQYATLALQNTHTYKQYATLRLDGRWEFSRTCTVGLDRGGSAVEAIVRFIARTPGPGADCGVATTARQRAVFALGIFWIEDATSGSRRGHVGSVATEGRGSGDRLKRKWRLVQHREIALRSRRRAFRGRATTAWRVEEARAAGPAP